MKTNFIKATLVVAIAVFTAACCPCKKVKSFSMTGTEWQLIELNGSVVERGEHSQDSYSLLLGDDSRFSGKGDCNRYFGSYKLNDDGTVEFGATGATRAMCPNQNRENQYFKMLDAAKRYKVDMEYLILTDDNNNIVSSFKIVKNK